MKLISENMKIRAKSLIKKKCSKVRKISGKIRGNRPSNSGRQPELIRVRAPRKPQIFPGFPEVVRGFSGDLKKIRDCPEHLRINSRGRREVQNINSKIILDLACWFTLKQGITDCSAALVKLLLINFVPACETQPSRTDLLLCVQLWFVNFRPNHVNMA